MKILTKKVCTLRGEVLVRDIGKKLSRNDFIIFEGRRNIDESQRFRRCVLND